MDARTEILDRIKKATADVTDPDPLHDVPHSWEYGRPIRTDDLVPIFVDKVRDYKATVVVVAADQVPAAIVAGLQATGAHSVVVPPGLAEAWVDAISLAGLKVRPDNALSHVELDQTDAVVTACAAGVADTGTIVLDHDADQGRRALTLVPDRHMCVIRADQVFSDVGEALQQVKPAVLERRPLTWISGGSATSDIELSRVDGVHGPRQLWVIVVD